MKLDMIFFLFSSLFILSSLIIYNVYNFLLHIFFSLQCTSLLLLLVNRNESQLMISESRCIPEDVKGFQMKKRYVEQKEMWLKEGRNRLDLSFYAFYITFVLQFTIQLTTAIVSLFSDLLIKKICFRCPRNFSFRLSWM